MAKRRANGEGSIYKDKKGRWRSALTVGEGRVYLSGRTQSEVRIKLEEERNKAKFGTPRDPTKESVKTWVEYWLDKHIQVHSAPATYAQYSYAADLIYSRDIGKIKLKALQRADVQAFIDSMVAEEEASSMRKKAFGVLRRAVRHAIDMEKIVRDPTLRIKGPSHKAKEVFPFEDYEAAKLIAESRGTRAHVAIVLGLTCGMRIGEILGLRREDIDLRKRSLKINQQAAEAKGIVSIRVPKTEQSIREIHLPEIAVKAIAEHSAILMKEGNAGHELLLPDREGNLEHRTSFARRDWKPLLRRLKLTERGFHHTRHTYATLSLNGGVDVRVVSKVMGHKKTSTTWDIYGHLVKGQQQQAKDCMDRLFG